MGSETACTGHEDGFGSYQSVIQVYDFGLSDLGTFCTKEDH
jgi:hypothetical protein